MINLELEKTYLAKALPPDLASCKNEIIEDIYVPQANYHAVLRLRHRGDHYEITKKIPIDDTDSTRQHEHTIELTRQEYDALAVSSTKKAAKRRYYCQIDGHDAEVDVYQGALLGLVIIDFEFKTEADLNAFTPPAICLADVSQEVFAAGGALAGKAYADIASQLQQYNYQPITISNQKEES